MKQSLGTNHYKTLRVHHQAAPAEIKHAYRKLVKEFHPDCNHHLGSHDRIAEINHAYDVLSNSQSRALYDRSLGLAKAKITVSANTHTSKGTKHSNYFDEDKKLDLWFRQVYAPISQTLNAIVDELEEQIDELAADPFDDDLMANFQIYLEKCQSSFTQAQAYFRTIPNPTSAAGVAAYLYHCLNHLGDGLEEFNYFTLNFDDHHLHTGQELWRMAVEMHDCACDAMQTLVK